MINGSYHVEDDGGKVGEDDETRMGQRMGLDEFFEMAEQLARSDGGPPRWFVPLECGPPLDNSPLLLYLPGIDGTGAGLALQHRKLGRMFDVWCLHIPVTDRTPFLDLVKVVERTMRSQIKEVPDRPIYLVRESIGACIALSVASRNHDLDLVLILTNPATSYDMIKQIELCPNKIFKKQKGTNSPDKLKPKLKTETKHNSQV